MVAILIGTPLSFFSKVKKRKACNHGILRGYTHDRGLGKQFESGALPARDSVNIQNRTDNLT